VKRFAVLLMGSVFFLLSFVGCQNRIGVEESNPEEVVRYQQEVIGNIISGEMTSKSAYKKLARISSPGYLDKYPKKLFIALLKQYEQYEEVDMDMVEYEIEGPVYEDETAANVFVIQKYGNGLTMERKITLTKVENKWLIEEDKIIR